MERLKRRESSVRMASAFLSGFLGFVVSAIVGSILTRSILYTATSRTQSFLFELDPRIALVVIGSSFLVAAVSGFLAFVKLKKRHEARLNELSTLMIEMKDGRKQNSAGGRGIAENAISLADRITMLLPKLVRRRNQDSLLFGVVAFILSEIVGSNLAIAILVGAIVWLYFRYENSKIYEREISKLEQQRSAFEQRKNDLIERLSAFH